MSIPSLAGSPETPFVDPDERLLTRFLWAAMVLALVVRVVFLASKPFWRDEAWVALLVGDPMRAIADARAVPVGFLFLTRTFGSLPLLPPEVTYRIVPLACGLVVVPLLAKLASALGASRRTGVVAAWVAAGLQPFVYYSRELKSYDIDLLLAVLLPLLWIRGFADTAPRRSARLALMACLVVTPWVSFGGIFPASAVLGWGGLACLRPGDRAQARDWLLCSLGFAASFTAAYSFALQAQSTSHFQHVFWHSSLFANQHTALAWKVPVAAWRYASISIGYVFAGIWPGVLALAAIGAWNWPRRHRGYLLWLAFATAGFCVAAGVADRYLIANGRHLLFAAPVLLLWSANGLEEIGLRFKKNPGLVVTLGLPIVLSLVWSVQSIESRVAPYQTQWTGFFRYDVLHDVDGALAKAQELVQRNDPLLVSNRNGYAFQFYARGRFPRAYYCERHCFDFTRRALRWLNGVEDVGWVLMTDEEEAYFGTFLDQQGFAHRPRATTKGIRLWQIRRLGNGEHALPGRRPYGHAGKPAKHGKQAIERPSRASGV